MKERLDGDDALLDIVTRYSRPTKTCKRVKSEDLPDAANRFRLTLQHDSRNATRMTTVDKTYVIDCRNRAAVEHVMKEIRRLMEELDGTVLGGQGECQGE